MSRVIVGDSVVQAGVTLTPPRSAHHPLLPQTLGPLSRKGMTFRMASLWNWVPWGLCDGNDCPEVRRETQPRSPSVRPWAGLLLSGQAGNNTSAPFHVMVGCSQFLRLLETRSEETQPHSHHHSRSQPATTLKKHNHTHAITAGVRQQRC